MTDIEIKDHEISFPLFPEEKEKDRSYSLHISSLSSLKKEDTPASLWILTPLLFQEKITKEGEDFFFNLTRSSLYEEWLRVWDSELLNMTFSFISSRSSYHTIEKKWDCFLLSFKLKGQEVFEHYNEKSSTLYENSLEQEPFGLVLIRIIPSNLSSGWTGLVHISFLLNPYQFTRYYHEFAEYLKSLHWNAFIMDYLKKKSATQLYHENLHNLENNILQQSYNYPIEEWREINKVKKPLPKEIGYFFFELPDSPSVPIIRKFSQRLAKKARPKHVLRNLEKKQYEWYYYYLDFNEFIETFENESSEFPSTKVIGKFQYVYPNPEFDKTYIPPVLRRKMNAAIHVHSQYKKNLNPFVLPYNFNWEAARKFDVILSWKRLYENLTPEIKRRLSSYKKERNQLWKEFVPPKAGKDFINEFKNLLKKNVLLLNKYGLRARYFSKSHSDFIQVFKKHWPEFALIKLDTLLSEGSNYASIITEDGRLDVNFMDPINLASKIDRLILIEYYHKFYGWIVAGIVFGVKRYSSSFTEQILSGIQLLTPFRHYGLSRIFVVIGVSLFDAVHEVDVVLEDSTIENIATLKTTEKMGMRTYGVFPNMAYSIMNYYRSLNQEKTGEKKEQHPCFSTSILRKFHYTNSLLGRLALSPRTFEKHMLTYQQNLSIHQAIEELRNEGLFKEYVNRSFLEESLGFSEPLRCKI